MKEYVTALVLAAIVAPISFLAGYFVCHILGM